MTTRRFPLELLFPPLCAIAGCGGTDISPPADSAAYETECDTVTPPMTSGGTYGPAWQVGDDTAAVLLDIGNVGDSSGGPGFDVLPPSIIPDEDPTDWTYDQVEDTYYRSPTALEMLDNPWLSAQDLLVIPPRPTRQDLSAGDGSVDVPIPIYEEFGGRPQEDLVFRTLQLGKVGTKEHVPFIEQRWEDDCLRRSTLDVSFSLYESRGFDSTDIDINDIVGSAISSATRDSLAVIGATEDLSFSMRGPYLPSHVPLELALPANEVHFYVIRTEFDPNPGQLLVGSGGGSSLSVDRTPSELTTSAHSAGGLLHLCFDGIENGGETDIDCGGPDCPPCEVSQTCHQASDCASRLCYMDKGNIPGVCTSQCSDGLDNDGDGFADTCDFNCVEHPDFGTDTTVHSVPLEHVKSIGLFGTMHYCTVNENTYLASFLEWSNAASLILNNVVPDQEPAGYDSTLRPPPFRVAMQGCIIAENTDISLRCDSSTPTSGSTPCPAELDDYPFWPISTLNWSVSTNGTNSRIWAYVDFLVEGGYLADTTPINVAALVTPVAGPNTANGLAVTYLDGVNNPSRAGALTLNGSSGRTGFTLAHEIGHTLGLEHDSTSYPDSTIPGIMSSSGGIAPVLDWDLLLPSNTTQGAAWQFTAPAKMVPRASGFGFLGCVDDSDCDNGHPGLVCSNITAACTVQP